MRFQAASCADTHTWGQLPIDPAASLLTVSPSLQCSGLLLALAKRNLKKANGRKSYFAGEGVCHVRLNCLTVFFFFPLSHTF